MEYNLKLMRQVYYAAFLELTGKTSENLILYKYNKAEEFVWLNGLGSTGRI